MAVVANKRSVMTLFSNSTDIYSHQVRIVLAEKGINVEIHDVSPQELPEDLLEVNPYGSFPTLVDRELVLYHARIIMEYLDERFPHPPLMPVYPIMRAKCRLMAHRLEQDWYTLYYQILNNEDADEARQSLINGLLSVGSVFQDYPYFMSEDFTLVDCVLAPLLWRLPYLGVELPKQSKGIVKYMQRVFDRDSFQASLSEDERELQL